MQYVPQSSASAIAVHFDVDGTPTPLDSAPTVTITRADGTELVTDAASAAGDPGTYTYDLTPIETATLDHLTATWSGEVSGDPVQLVTYIEVVGCRLFTVGQARQRGALSRESNYDALQITMAHDLALAALEDACGRALVPHRRRVTVDGSGTTALILPEPNPIAVTWVEVSATALTVDELAEVKVYAGGILRRTSIWPAGLQNIEVDYSFGYKVPPLRLQRAAILLAENWLVESAIPDRATVLSTEQGSFQLVTAGVRGASFEIPEVNAAVAEYRWHEFGVG